MACLFNRFTQGQLGQILLSKCLVVPYIEVRVIRDREIIHTGIKLSREVQSSNHLIAQIAPFLKNGGFSIEVKFAQFVATRGPWLRFTRIFLNILFTSVM